MKRNQIVLIIVALAVLAVGVFYFVTRSSKVMVIDKDTTIKGDFIVSAAQKLLIKNGAKIVIEGNAKINGAVESDSGIAMVVKAGAVFGSNAKVVSNGHLQVVDEIEKLALTKDQLEELYNDTVKDTGTGPRIGPFVDESKTSQDQPRVIGVGVAALGALAAEPAADSATPQPCIDAQGLGVPDCFEFSGQWFIGSPERRPPGSIGVSTPPAGVDRILLNFNFGRGRRVNLTNLTIFGPDGRDGLDDEGQNCQARGASGEDAMRFRVNAGVIAVNNFSLYLGNGGDGGNAQTPRDCVSAAATGGNGGQSGNFKMEASGSFRIDGAFTVYPGFGGNGGYAKAYSKDAASGYPNGENSGDASAVGGAGAHNVKNLRADGRVRGGNFVNVTSTRGGQGGSAEAITGKGGYGKDCPGGQNRGGNGGKAGNAASGGGRGGSAELIVFGRTAEARGGNAGSVISRAGNGGLGGRCAPPEIKAGGSGGSGGNAGADKGTAGTGTTAAGTDGVVIAEQGGNGGKGGDGCLPGKGGLKGSGTQPGIDGASGLNLCRPQTQTETTPPPPPTIAKIKVIQYQSKYIPITELMQEVGPECNQELHWHTKTGIAKATDGTIVPDRTGCGLGKVSQVPIIEIESK